MQCRYLMNGLLSEVQNQYQREQLHCLSDDHNGEFVSCECVRGGLYIYIYILCEVQVCQRWYQHAQKCST